MIYRKGTGYIIRVNPTIMNYKKTNVDEYKHVCLEVFGQHYPVKDADSAFISQGQPWAPNKMQNYLKKFDEFVTTLSNASDF